MKLSTNTIQVLKNFATIQPSILLKEGHILSTIAANSNILASAEVSDTFPAEVGIYDLNELLNVLSLFEDPDLQFNEKFVTITDGSQSCNYFYMNPELIKAPTKNKLDMNNEAFDINVTTDQIQQVLKAASILSLEDIVIFNIGSEVFISITEDQNDSANNFKISVGNYDGGAKFKMKLKAEVLRLLPYDYVVTVGSIGDRFLARFTSQANKVNYWIALEASSFMGE